MILDIFKKKLACRGSVLFRGTIPGRPEEFSYLTKRGIQITSGPQLPNTAWTLALSHATWGKARLTSPGGGMLTTPALIEHTPHFSKRERQAASSAGCELVVETQTSRSNIPADRKCMLRFLEAVMGEDGVAAVDWQSLRLWSPIALREELAHNADLDVSQLFGVHVVSQNDSDDPIWFHTHGLGAIGRFDFDILNPSDSLFTSAMDTQRAIAYAILEGTVDCSTSRYVLAKPGGEIRFVPVEQFEREAGDELNALRPGGDDEYHGAQRAILCDPAGRIFKGKIKPSRFLSNEIPDGTIFGMSTTATELMAERARKTYSVFRELAELVREHEFPVIVKLGYERDGGEKDDREHLWFTVNELSDSKIDATLVNTPFAIAIMKEGDRGVHDIERMTDWTILTPFGSISPRDQTPARLLREKEVLEALRKHDRWKAIQP